MGHGEEIIYVTQYSCSGCGPTNCEFKTTSVLLPDEPRASCAEISSCGNIEACDIIDRIGFALKAPIIDDQPNLLVSGYDVELEKKGSLAET